MIKIKQLLHSLTRIQQPGALPPVDMFPFLNWVPQRFLGNWRDKAQNVRSQINDLYLGTYDHVFERHRTEGSIGCFADTVIEQRESLGWDRHTAGFTSGLMMEAGSDTTSTALIIFLHLAAKYPEALEQAQHEIDQVMGDDRSPSWADFADLPSVQGVIKEVLRHRPLAPIAFPHALSEGMFAAGRGQHITNVA